MTRDRHKSKQPNPKYEAIANQIENRIPQDVKHVSYSAGGHTAEIRRHLILRTQPISIGLPMDELMFSKFFVNYCGIDWMPWDAVITTVSTYLPDARNKIHNMFLENDTTSHLLMLDSDVLAPPDIISKLLDHDKDLVGGFYRKKEHFPLVNPDGSKRFIQRPVVYDFDSYKDGVPMYVARMEAGKGLESVAAMGAGCWLMSRKLAEALGKNPYDMNSGGEDMVICKKVKDLGYDIWVDWGIPCAHAGVMYV